MNNVEVELDQSMQHVFVRCLLYILLVCWAHAVVFPFIAVFTILANCFVCAKATPRPTCATTRCGAPLRCQMFEGKPHCVDSCYANRCSQGMRCKEEQVVCKKAPCSPVVTCERAGKLMLTQRSDVCVSVLHALHLCKPNLSQDWNCCFWNFQRDSESASHNFTWEWLLTVHFLQLCEAWPALLVIAAQNFQV